MGCKYKGVILFLLILFSGEIFSHPLHLTLTNIDIEADSIKVVIRILETDFENALADYYTRSPSNIKSGSDIIGAESIKDYINYYFKIRTQTGEVNLNYVGFIRNESSIQIYFNGHFNMDEQTITIENELLENLNGDQRNLVVIGANNNEEGIEFNASKTKKTITLGN